MTRLDDSQQPGPSVGELILDRLRELHQLHLRGVYAIASCELNLAAIVADRAFRDGRFAGIVRYSMRDADGMAHVLYGDEILRVAFGQPADCFAWTLLTHEEWFDRHRQPPAGDYRGIRDRGRGRFRRRRNCGPA